MRPTTAASVTARLSPAARRSTAGVSPAGGAAAKNALQRQRDLFGQPGCPVGDGQARWPPGDLRFSAFGHRRDRRAAVPAFHLLVALDPAAPRAVPACRVHLPCTAEIAGHLGSASSRSLA